MNSQIAKRELSLIVAIGIMTFFSLVVWPGYDVFMGDHKVYVPAMMQSLTPELFQNDLLLKYAPVKYSFFDELVTYSVNFFKTDILHVLFTLTIIVRFILLYSIYKILRYFTNDSIFPFIALFIIIAGRFLNISFNTYLVPRGASLAFNLLFVALYINKQKLLSTLFLGFGLVINPIICLPFLIFFYIDLIIKRDSLSRALLAGCVPVLFLIMLLASVSGGGASALSLISSLDSPWDEILRFRFHDLYLLSWVNINYFSFAAISIFCFTISRLELGHIFDDPDKKRYLYSLFLIPLFSILLYIIGFDILRINAIELTQVIRSRFFWQIITVPLFIFYAYGHIKSSPDDIMFNFSLIGVSISFAIRGGGYAPLAYIPLLLFLWIKRNYNFLETTGFSLLKMRQLPLVILALSLSVTAAIPIMMNDFKALLYLALTIPLSLFTVMLMARTADFSSGPKPVYAALSLMVLSCIFALPGYNIYPAYYSDKPLMEACNWIKINTNIKDVFITEPFTNSSGTLRLSCYRNIFTTFEDGGGVQFNRDYAMEWKKRYDSVTALKDNSSLIPKLLSNHDIDYIFSDHAINISYPLVFNNTKYFIYKLDAPAG